MIVRLVPHGNLLCLFFGQRFSVSTTVPGRCVYGFPEESAWLAGQLANPTFRAALLAEYQQFLTAQQDDRALLRFHYHHLDGMLAGLRDLDLPRKRLGEITHENLIGNGNWQTRTVAKILRAGVYAGDLVQGVSKVIDHKQVRASADEWTVVRDTHEAIVSRELFDAVQKALDHAAQQAKDREIHSWSPNLLRGKIFCAHCGHSLHRQKCVRKKTPDVCVIVRFPSSSSRDSIANAFRRQSEPSR